MPKEKTTVRQEKKKGLADAELIEKYESGKQPIADMINVLLSKPAPNATVKVAKRP